MISLECNKNEHEALEALELHTIKQVEHSFLQVVLTILSIRNQQKFLPVNLSNFSE